MAAEPEHAEQSLDWDRVAAGWGKRADRIRQHGMPVSRAMLDAAGLQPGMRVLELAAGPGDTGFLAAELIAPGGRLISSDSSEAMLELARSRAQQQGIANVEFKQLRLEWIDEPTASFDVILCRWGVMLSDDPAAALQECRRVLAPGGRLVVAVWDAAERNPWTTVLGDLVVERGLAPPPDRDAPGMFALAAPGRLEQLLGDAGFVGWEVTAVELARAYPSVDEWLEESLDVSLFLSGVWARLDEQQRSEFRAEVATRAARYAAPDGALLLPGSSLVAAAW